MAKKFMPMVAVLILVALLLSGLPPQPVEASPDPLVGSGINWFLNSDSKVYTPTIGSWQDVDLSGDSDILDGTTGVVIEVINEDTSNHSYGLRPNGNSTDTSGGIVKAESYINFVKLDGDKVFEAYRDNANVKFYVRGYFDGKATFLSNPSGKTSQSGWAWQTFDLSADGVTGDSLVLLEAIGGGCRKFRPSSTEGCEILIRSDNCHQGVISKCTSSSSLDIYHAGTANFRVLGYIEDLGTWKSSASSDVGDGTANQWNDKDATSDTSNNARIIFGYWKVGWPGGYKADFREEGSSDDQHDYGTGRYTSPYGEHFFLVGVDSQQQWEIWISHASRVNAYITGYTEPPPNQPPNAPGNLGPASYVDGSWGNDNTPTLTFTQSDPDVGDTVKYTIQIDDSSDFLSPVVDYTSGLLPQGGASFTVGQAAGGGLYAIGFEGQTLPDGTYYWQVMSTDNDAATSGWSTANGGAIAFRVETAPQTGGSSDSTGAAKEEYSTGDDVYATANGFFPDSNMDIYVVEDTEWSNGDPIPADVGDGMDTILTDGSGNLGPVVIWSAPLEVGEYDLVFDANQDGFYDAIIDLVNHPNHPGFVVLAPPIAGFSAQPTAGEAPLTVQFADESTGGDINSWSWDFGDGDISDEQNPSHTYTTEGLYTVNLTVSGPGGTYTETKEDYIRVYEAPAPVTKKAPKPARLSVRNLRVMPAEVYPNDWVTIDFDVKNSGGRRGSKVVEVLINGYREHSERVSVYPGSSKHVRCFVYKTIPGQYIVTVEEATGWFNVLHLPESGQPSYTVVELDNGDGLGTGGIIAIVVIGIMVIAGIIVAIMMTHRV